MIKNFKFVLDHGAMIIYYSGNTLGEALLAFYKHRPEYVQKITSVEEQ